MPRILCVSAILLAFWAISLHNLTIVPRVYEDEAWQASTGWKIAQEGVFGSDLFAGWAGSERHYYGYLPLHPFLLALIYRVADLGLFQTRFEPVALGMLTLALTYSLAHRVFRDWRIGWLAALLLITVRASGLTVYQLTGILMLDMARIARYDMLVPVLGLGALHAYLSARTRQSTLWYVLCGGLAGLAGLAHLYGAFWLPVLGVLVLTDGGAVKREQASPSPTRTNRIRAVGGVLVGFVLPWLPYLVYVLGGLEDWRGQTQLYAVRFDLLNPRWYLENVLLEYHRYGPGLENSFTGQITRVGFWAAVVAVPFALGALGVRAWKGDWRARVIVTPALMLPLLFALLLLLKLVNYAVTIFPLIAIACAWGAVTLWTRLQNLEKGRWLRPALALLLTAIVVEGVMRVAVLEAAATTTTPYDQLTKQVREFMPPQARVLGYHTFWLGLADYDYRSIIVPLLWTDPQNKPRRYALDEGLSLIAPDIVLLNGRMRDYFEGGVPPEQDLELFFQWLEQHNGTVIGRVDDPTYGVIEIYRIWSP